MTISLVEHADSRKLTQTVNGQGQRLRWTAQRSKDETAVRAALIAAAPVTWDGLTLVGHDATPFGSSGVWDCTADYAYSAEQAGGVRALTAPGIDDPLGPEFEFDLTAQQAHVSQSLLTVTSRYDSSAGGINPPNAWLVSTAYVVGARVTAGSGLYVCTTAGTSSGAGSGPSGTGTGIADGSCVWDYVGVAGAAVKVWTASTAYTTGTKVDSHGYLYECTNNGTSSATSDGPEGTGTTILDGTARWKYVGPDLDPAAPDFGGAIGVSRDRVNGTDVYVGHLEFCITAQVYPMTLRLIQTLKDLVGCFNQSTWYNFPPKTLLYLGCPGSPRPENIWTLKHRFAASANVRNLAVGSKLTIPFKGGFDHLWAGYTDTLVTTTTGTFPVQTPYAAYVEQVVRPGDFTTLPI